MGVETGTGACAVCQHEANWHQDGIGKCWGPECPCRSFVPANDTRGVTRILAIDPSWVTGISIVELDTRGIQHVDRLPLNPVSEYITVYLETVIDVSKRKNDSAQQKISEIVSKIDDVLLKNKVDVLAIELPFAGIAKSGGVSDPSRSFRSKDSINQGRLFQAIIDYAIANGLYHHPYSEVHQAQAKASVVCGIGIKKELAQKVAIDLYGLKPEGTKLHREALVDAALVGLGYIRLVHKDLVLPRLVK